MEVQVVRSAFLHPRGHPKSPWRHESRGMRGKKKELRKAPRGYPPQLSDMCESSVQSKEENKQTYLRVLITSLRLPTPAGSDKTAFRLCLMHSCAAPRHTCGLPVCHAPVLLTPSQHFFTTRTQNACVYLQWETHRKLVFDRPANLQLNVGALWYLLICRRVVVWQELGNSVHVLNKGAIQSLTVLTRIQGLLACNGAVANVPVRIQIL